MRQILAAFLLISSITLSAENPKSQVVNLEVNENGLLILPVKLSDENGNSKTYRFALDSGAGTCVIDPSINESFFRTLPEVGAAQAVDGNGKSIECSYVSLKRIDAGGLSRDGIIAVQMDMKETMMGRSQDDPIDGILGMSFLRQTRFLLDIPKVQLTWFATLQYPEVIRVQYRGDGVPIATMNLGEKQFPAEVDTGACGLLEVPNAIVPKDVPRQPRMAGSFASLVRAETAVLELGALTRTFGARIVGLSKGDQGVLGQDAFKAGPAFFDFCFDFIALPPGTDKHWATITQDPINPSLVWDRSGATPVLELLGVFPGSKLEKAGLCNGDRIMRVGTLEGKALNRRMLLKLISKKEPSVWTIIRNGNTIVVNVGA